MLNVARTRILMALGLSSLLAGLWAALVRIGWDLPALQASLTAAHGPLMVSGFLGTLLTLERAVAVGRRWMYAGPLLSGLGALATMLGLAPLGPLAIALGSLVAVCIYVVIVRRQPALFTLTMLGGAVVWLSANVLWLAGLPIFRVVLWWAGFLVLTIAGERLELSRVLRLTRQKQITFALALGVLLAGLLLTIVAFDFGVRIVSLGMGALATWLVLYDIARRTIHRSDLTRFIAACLLAGYCWLAVSGVLGVVMGGVIAGVQYDALLHAIFLGFVFSMIFGHAPIILPAVLHVSLPYRSSFYVHLVALHLSLLLRIVSDLLAWPPGRMWGGLLNVAAVLLFLVNTGRVIYTNRTNGTAEHRRPTP
jgi:hypothetical protein